MHHEAVARRQGVSWAAGNGLHDIANGVCARQESIEVSLAGALKLNQAGQVIGSEEAKTDPLYLSCEEQAR